MASTTPIINIVPPVPPTEDSFESSDDSSESTEVEEGFYYEVAITCTNDDGDQEDHAIIFNFGSESNYDEHAEGGFEDFDEYFHDAISLNHPEWDYADEWEELHLHGPVLPEHHDGVIIDID